MRRPYLVSLVSAAVLGGCATSIEQPALPVGLAQIAKRDGTPAGTARVYSDGNEAIISVALSGLQPGLYALHISKTGLCEAGDFAPIDADLYDLPNATIDAKGSGTVSTILPGTPAEAYAAIFDDDGSAVTVQWEARDLTTDPAKAAGQHIACGVLSPL